MDISYGNVKPTSDGQHRESRQVNIEAIIRTIALVGSDLPAYKALFDQIVASMHSDDQATLQQTYADAMAAAARAHAAAQAE